MPIRVSYLLSAIHSPHAGTEGHLLRLIRSLDRSLFEPELILMQSTEWARQFDDPLVPVTNLEFVSFRRPQDWLVVSKLAKHFRKRKTDIVEMHSTDAQLVGGAAARLSGVPVAISCRRNLGYQYGAREKVLQPIANRLATTFLANAHIVAREMGRLEGIAPEQFQVIHNGIDLAAFDAASQQEDEHVTEFRSATAGKRVVSIAANLRPVKNYPLFIQAAAIVGKQLDDVTFAIMGQGEQRSELEAFANRLGIGERILWLGSVPSVAPYLMHSDIGCLTSTSEGFSNAIIESMAARLPVVVTDVGGASEAVSEESGYVVPSDDADAFAERLLTLLHMPERERTEMGQRGRRRVEERFSMAAQLDAYHALYTTERDRLAPRANDVAESPKVSC